MDAVALPDKYYTTTSCIQDLVDKIVFVTLRDGKNIIGVLRTFDQFGTIVIQDAVERIYTQKAFGDIDRGVFLIRGENIVVIGELCSELNTDAELGALSVSKLPIEEVLELRRLELESSTSISKNTETRLKMLGFSP
ncbi:hypothetical protein BB560_007106 [Smittium megazygosporum]|uniref:U6 snRNA-associated Sm-like protein LSm1 n=1 Tax=Smittium megazygosporum TaxID=133381 RepID=A0A2T9XYS5_9FUNG|nr:hypothetical protein BB560_007106 [Smittium megazygosporum]